MRVTKRETLTPEQWEADMADIATIDDLDLRREARAHFLATYRKGRPPKKEQTDD